MVVVGLVENGDEALDECVVITLVEELIPFEEVVVDFVTIDDLVVEKGRSSFFW